jgi:hypothetical protein
VLPSGHCERPIAKRGYPRGLAIASLLGLWLTHAPQALFECMLVVCVVLLML